MRKRGRPTAAMVVVAAALLLPMILPLAVPSASANITITISTLGNGQPESLLLFSAAGSKSTLNLTVQTGLRASSAFLSITGSPYTMGGKDAPESPSLDVGEDGDVEWKFNGTGYGALGFQYLFSNGNPSARLTYGPGGGNDTSLSLRFPAGSTLTGAYVDLTVADLLNGTVNITLDLGNDNQTDWSGVDLTNSTGTATGFAAVITTYLSNAQPSGPDTFGVRYVDVPLRVECNDTANITLTNLTMPYDCKVRTNDFSAELNSLVPAAPGPEMTSVPLKLSSDSAGRLKLSNVLITTQPPVHVPTLTNQFPATDLAMDEDSSLQLRITPGDHYGNPVTLQWLVDSVAVPGANGTLYTFLTDFNSSGKHVLSVVANNTLAESSWTWNITVRNVNRLPLILDYNPKGNPYVSENSSMLLNVTAHDPDGTALSYLWSVDGAAVPQQSTSSFLFSPAFGQAGTHPITVSVVDNDGGVTNVTWSVAVRRTNIPPQIVASLPLADPTVRETGRVEFSVSATDINGDPLSYAWAVDGNQAGEGRWFNYTPDYSAQGKREVKVLVSDGEFTVGRTWSVTVEDMNRAPVAVIDRPREGEEFMLPANVTFSGALSSDPDKDSLTLKWFDGSVELGSSAALQISLARGRHNIRLVVEDGKGGHSEALVNISIREVALSAIMSVSGSYKEGEPVKVTITLTNNGDYPAIDYPLKLYMDGDSQGTITVPRIDPGRTVKHTFTVNAPSGKHDFSSTVGNSTLAKSVTITAGAPSWLMPLLILTIISVVIIAVAGFLYWRTKVFQKEAGKAGPPRPKLSEEDKPIHRVPASAPSPPLLPKSPKGTHREPEKTTKPDDSDSPYDDGSLLDKIILEDAPYREKSLDIQTTIQQRIKPDESVKEELSTKSVQKVKPQEPSLTIRDESGKPAAETDTSDRVKLSPSSAPPQRVEVVSVAPVSASKLFTGEQHDTETERESGADGGGTAEDEGEKEESAAAPSALSAFSREGPPPPKVIRPGPARRPAASAEDEKPPAPPYSAPRPGPEPEKPAPRPTPPQAPDRGMESRSTPASSTPIIERMPEAPPKPPEPSRPPTPAVESPAPPASTPSSIPATTPKPSESGSLEQRVNELEKKVLASEMKGIDITASRRSLGLARSFQRGGIPLKAEQYLKKAEEQLADAEMRKDFKPSKCPSCGTAMEPGWVQCPECGKQLK